MRIVLPLLLTIPIPAGALDYQIKGDNLSISLADTATGISPIETIFLDEEFLVIVEGLAWVFTNTTGGDTSFTWETFVDGESVASGKQDLSPQVVRELPGSFAAGSGVVGSKSRANIEVAVTLDGVTTTASTEKEAFGALVSFIPLVLVLFLSATTGMVEFSLFSAIFAGACIVEGDLFDGFKATLDSYIMNAAASIDHLYVVMFVLFLSGLVSVLERSGGMQGFTNTVAKYAQSSRSGQLATFAIGLFIFFDDYANVLLAGESMRSLTDVLFISREKLAFIVGATAEPIASLSPVSSWVGFEVGLIQDQINLLIEKYGEENLTIETSGFGVLLLTIQYRYYPILMIGLVPLLSWFQREFGPMLIAERKVQVYRRIDGGDGALAHPGGSYSESPNANRPRQGQPLKAWNLFVPILVLIFLIFYSLIQTGSTTGERQTFTDKLQASDSYSALLWSTMGAVLVTILFFHLQIVQGDCIVMPTVELLKALFRKSLVAEREKKPRFLMSFSESLDGLLHGMSCIFPSLIVLILAWASGSVMTTIGVDRQVSKWIVGSFSASVLPTFSFLISGLMSLSTGTSWGTMAIMMPLITVPAYEASQGDATIVYATIAGILSGAVAGDHLSLIGNTAVLTSLACDCTLLNHVYSQAAYAIVITVLSILLGTLPIGLVAWPNIVSLLLCTLSIGVFVLFFCKPVVSADGSFDFFTELIFKLKGSNETLEKLKSDTRDAFIDHDRTSAEDESDHKGRISEEGISVHRNFDHDGSE